MILPGPPGASASEAGAILLGAYGLVLFRFISRDIQDKAVR